MAYGSEVILGWRLEEFFKIQGLSVEEGEDGDERELIGEKIQMLYPRDTLMQAQIDALKESGICIGSAQRVSSSGGIRYFKCQTPRGEREFSGWSVEIQGDDDEMGYEYPKDFLVGISISARYYPSYLDWEDEHGTLSVVCLDDIKSLVDIAKKHLAKIDPNFINSHIFIMDFHY